ncbi:hypothetical protein [Actinoplanes sp. NPDC049599]|uniref:hypothetical protein n=1 Tax=Actinoplanes sp. NPDC049599 TaxID=3363903 RepID=UPI0037B320F2
MADLDRALELVEDGPTEADDVPTVSAKSLTEVTLASLHRIAATPDTAATKGQVTAPVSVDRWEGPWLQVVADHVTTAIAAISNDRLHAVTRAWAETEEWQYATADELAPLVRSLRDVARQASPQRRLYLWTCL